MTRAVRSELRKLRTTRSLWAVPAGAVAISVLAATVLVGWIDATDPASRLSGHGPLRFGATNLGLFLLVFGIRTFGDETHHRTIAATYVLQPRRGRVLAAKLLLVGAVSAAVSAVIYAVVVPLTVVVMDRRAIPMEVDLVETAALFGRATVAMVLLGTLGVALAATVGNRTIALVGAVVWLALGETIVGGLSRHPEWMPGSLVQSLVTAASGPDAVGPGPAVSALVALTVASLGGALVSLRRDVP